MSETSGSKILLMVWICTCSIVDFWQRRTEGEQAHRAEIWPTETQEQRDKKINARLQIQDPKRLRLLVAKWPWLNYEATSQVETWTKLGIACLCEIDFVWGSRSNIISSIHRYAFFCWNFSNSLLKHLNFHTISLCFTVKATSLLLLTLSACAAHRHRSLPYSVHGPLVSYRWSWDDSGFFSTLRICIHVFSCHAMCILVVPFDSLASYACMHAWYCSVWTQASNLQW